MQCNSHKITCNKTFERSKKMQDRKYYPKKQNNHNNQVPSITKPFAFDNRVRCTKV